MTIISVVMPAYNVEKYIAEAIDSVINQSFSDWELIIVNDCSTDKTRSIVEKYQKIDSRIYIYDTEKNSGACRLPRFMGIKESKGEFVSSIDADDFIEPDFIQKLYDRHKQTNADIVTGRMVLCNEDGTQREPMMSIPDLEFDMQQILSGKEACKLTIGGWKLAMNGMLVKGNIYKQYVNKESLDEYNYGYADEIDSRKILLSANKIVLCDSIYYYRQQPNSIVHRVSIKAFDVLYAMDRLYELVQKEFNNEEDVFNGIYREYIGALINCQRILLTGYNRYTEEEKIIINKRIKYAYSIVKKQRMKGQTLKQKIAIIHYSLFIIISKILFGYHSHAK